MSDSDEVYERANPRTVQQPAPVVDRAETDDLVFEVECDDPIDTAEPGMATNPAYTWRALHNRWGPQPCPPLMRIYDSGHYNFVPKDMSQAFASGEMLLLCCLLWTTGLFDTNLTRNVYENIQLLVGRFFGKHNNSKDHELWDTLGRQQAFYTAFGGGAGRWSDRIDRDPRKHDLATVRCVAQISRRFFGIFGKVRCTQCYWNVPLGKVSFRVVRKSWPCAQCNFHDSRYRWIGRAGHSSGECEAHLICGTCVHHLGVWANRRHPTTIDEYP
jgi:hypothetical protein